jgi:hypothetical protein
MLAGVNDEWYYYVVLSFQRLFNSDGYHSLKTSACFGVLETVFSTM